MALDTFIIEHFPVGMLQCNCTVLGYKNQKEAVVIDPGDEASHILSILKKHKLTLKYILLTHAHIDHIGGAGYLKDQTGAEIFIHPEDEYLYNNITMQAGWVGMESPPWRPADRRLTDKEQISLGSITLDVIHTPGHSPGSVTFSLKGEQPVLFTGDTLFQGSIGRTDLWGGSFDAIMESIKTRLLLFSDNTLVYPGHGPTTTIGQEKTHNPFITSSSQLLL